MKAIYPYKGIHQTMNKMRSQIVDSIPYCEENFSGFSDPGRLFNYLKSLVHYVNDPGDRELLQSAKTLLTNKNIHGSPGAGDCDCFTILATAAFLCNGMKTKIVLAGRDKKNPVHIYNRVLDPTDGKWKAFDLTNSFYTDERTYPYKQLLPVSIIKR